MPVRSRNRLGIATMALAVVVAAGTRTATATDDLAARRVRVEQMSPAEQQDLARKQEQFLALPAEEQKRLRELQATIDADPRADKLNGVLKHYHEWLRTLSTAERTELMELPIEDRIARIKQIQQRQQAARLQAQRAELLSSKDMRWLVRWTEDLLWEHRDRIFAAMPEAWRKKVEKEDPQRQRRSLLLMASFSARRSGSHPMANVKSADIEKLAAKLSQPAKDELTKAPDLPEQRKIVSGWLGTAMNQLEPWKGPRKLPAAVDEELTQFFEKDLRPQQRERLLGMPNDQMREELRRMYFEHEHWNKGPGPGRGGGPSDRPFDRGKNFRGKGPRDPQGDKDAAPELKQP